MLIDIFWQSVSQMYIKLKSFQESRVKKQTTSSLADRFKFRGATERPRQEFEDDKHLEQTS
jgi:hypothetical protein